MLSTLELDLMCAIARIEQIGRDGPETIGGLVLERLVTCDAPRLRSHLSEDARAQLDAQRAATKRVFGTEVRVR